MRNNNIGIILFMLWWYNIVLTSTVASYFNNIVPYAGDLRTEHATRPIGLNTSKPRFSWAMIIPKTNIRGWRQYSYQLQINNRGKIVWKSDEVITNQSTLIIYGGKQNLSDNVLYSWRIRLKSTWTGQNEPVQGNWSATAEFALAAKRLQFENWISNIDNINGVECPWFRTSIDIPSLWHTSNAFIVVHVASIGYHELYINGNKVDSRVLAPSVSLLSKRILINSYDITDFIIEGENIMGIWAASGWAMFKGVNPVMDFNVSSNPAFSLEIYVDGKPIVNNQLPIWKTHVSSVQHIGDWTNSNFGGDHLNASRHIDEWASRTLNDQSWPVADIKKKKELLHFNTIISEDMSPPTRKLSMVAAKSISHQSSSSDNNNNDDDIKKPNNTFVIEMEKLFTGWIELEIIGEPGSTAIIECSTWSIRSMEMNMMHKYTFNRSGTGIFEVRFSYHEIKYITVINVDGILSIKGWRIGVDFERTGYFNSSNPLLTQVYTNTVTNFQGLTTGGMSVDCPHRERLGYGDAEQTAIEFAMNTYRTARFYSKRAIDWSDSVDLMGMICQNSSARGCTRHKLDPPKWSEVIPHSAPTLDGGGGPAWLAAVVTVPLEIYKLYNDIEPLKKALPAQLAYLKKLDEYVDNNTKLLMPFGGFWGFLGDWLTPHLVVNGGGSNSEHSNTTQAMLFNNCWYLYMLNTVSNSCRLLGLKEQASVLEEKSKLLGPAIHKHFFNANNNTYLYGRQSHYILPLWSGAVPEHLQEIVKKNLLKEIQHGIVSGNPGHLDTGQFGTWLLTKMLVSMNRPDLLVEISTQNTYPGYGYFIKLGFETWPEAWNVSPPRSNKPKFLPSQMHGCYNGIGSYFHNALAGIKILPNYEIEIRPAIGVGNLKWISAEMNPGFGRIAISWHVTYPQQCVILSVVIPPNAVAYLQLNVSGGIKGIKEKYNNDIWGVDIQVDEHQDIGNNIYKVTNVDLKIKSGVFEFHYQLPGSNSSNVKCLEDN